MNKKSFWVFLFGILPFCLNSFAQSSPNAIVDQMIASIRSKKPLSTNTEILFAPKNISASILSLGRYLNDSTNEVRHFAYTNISALGIKATETSIRQQAITSLLQGTKDRNPVIATLAWQQLLTFPVKDFDGKPLEDLNKFAPNETLTPEYWAMTVGYLNLKSKEKSVESLLNSNISPIQRWKIHLALSRLNNKTSTEYILSKINQAKTNDDWVTSLVPDLVYTRSKPIFETLFEKIKSDETNCTSPNPDAITPINCAYGILGSVAPVIKNFPVQVDISGDLVGDYKKALLSARAWIDKNQKSYSFID